MSQNHTEVNFFGDYKARHEINLRNFRTKLAEIEKDLNKMLLIENPTARQAQYIKKLKKIQESLKFNIANTVMHTQLHRPYGL